MACVLNISGVIDNETVREYDLVYATALTLLTSDFV